MRRFVDGGSLERRRRLSLLAACAIGLPCIWDSDTLAEEQRESPGAFEVVVGRFVQHDPAYYRQRIERLTNLDRELTLGELDDLAVAHERLGAHDHAIEIIQRKLPLIERLSPGIREAADHRYRYHANLGTFLVHSGRLGEGVTELEKALEINPSAHFGRERYQIHVIRWATTLGKSGEAESIEDLLFGGFGSELPANGSDAFDRDDAVEALEGMLRLGGGPSVTLLRALGDVHQMRSDLNLAWWSYRHALELAGGAHPSLERLLAYIEDHWEEAARYNGRRNVPPNPEEYAAVRAAARAFGEEFRALERAAIERGEDVSEPNVQDHWIRMADARTAAAFARAQPTTPWTAMFTYHEWLMLACGAVCACAIATYVVQRVRARPSTEESGPTR